MSKHITQMTPSQYEDLLFHYHRIIEHLSLADDYARKAVLDLGYKNLPDDGLRPEFIMNTLVAWPVEEWPPPLEDFLKRTGQHVAVGVSPKTVVRKEPYWRYDGLPLTKKPVLVLMRNGEHRVVRPGLALSISDTKAWMPIPEE